MHFILGARLRNVKEIYETVLSRGGRYHVVHEARQKSTGPSPLKVKEVRVGERRYVVCLNDEQAKKDRVDREAIVSALREQVKQSAQSMVGNKGYRKYLRNDGKKFEWSEILRDLEALQYVDVEHHGKHFRLRSEVQGTCSAVFRAEGVAIPPTIQRIH